MLIQQRFSSSANPHIPTNTVVECQDERSQTLENKARAMSFVASKILSVQREKQQQERSEQRRLQVGSGDRSESVYEL